MNSSDLKKRTKQFGDFIARQLLRCGTAVGANYRSACRARSGADFISKIGIAIEEADESLYWMEMIIESGLLPEARLRDLMKEADEIISILTASSRTAKRNLYNQKSAIKHQQ